MMKATEQFTFLLEVLKITYTSKGDRQVVYPLLQKKLVHLDEGLASLLLLWASERLTTAKPATAKTLAETVLNFSELMAQFPQGSKESNLSIAIAGYQAALRVFTEELYPQEFAKAEAALIAAKDERQQILEFEAISADVVQLRQQLAATEATLKRMAEEVTASKVGNHQWDLTPLIETIREIQPRENVTQFGIILPKEEFNTAILYDIENLTKGYNFTQNFISKLSLQRIVKQIRSQHQFGKLAIQRAYANWSVPQLKQIKNEILSLGIEPIQVFGFGLNYKKNAADIQLTIDAIEFIHNKPSIQLFIIVSGDGAFASVANKLHEYGKTVIGCAYEKSTNSFLEAVCDAFVPIPDPETIVVKVIQPQNEDEILVEARAILQWLNQHPEYSRQLSAEGMYLSEVWKAFHQRIPNFNYKLFGFEKWKPCLNFICAGTEFSVIDKTPTESRLVVKDVKDAVVSEVPDRAACAQRNRETVASAIVEVEVEAKKMPTSVSGNIHSLSKYRKILSAGYPIFRLPPPSDLSQVLACLVQNPLIGEKLGEGIAKLTSLMAPSVSQQSVKKSLLVLLSADCFVTEPEGGNLPDLSLTLKPELNSSEAVLQAVADLMRTKLLKHMTHIDENIWRELMPLS
ncbi:MAG: NYN domain-containing protein [Hormoscilla sp. GM7CHS1pb]|nr:NYN domain-containing protein [Hormoscilla sp. GM7CHS1pb]